MFEQIAPCACAVVDVYYLKKTKNTFHKYVESLHYDVKSHFTIVKLMYNFDNLRLFLSY